MPSKTFDFTVEGRTTFPFDMLRYDGCHPATEQDSSQIERSTQRAGFDRARVFTVKLSGTRSPTDARWESFGWRVL